MLHSKSEHTGKTGERFAPPSNRMLDTSRTSGGHECPKCHKTIPEFAMARHLRVEHND